MSRKPRLVDLFGPAKPKRRHLVTQDGTLIVHGEAYPIAGERLALDEHHKLSPVPVTFDGAVPSPKS